MLTTLMLGLARLADARWRRPRCSRTLNHRVKGVSMSTFTLEEVGKLAAAGNEVRRFRGCARSMRAAR